MVSASFKVMVSGTRYHDHVELSRSQTHGATLAEIEIVDHPKNKPQSWYAVTSAVLVKRISTMQQTK